MDQQLPELKNFILPVSQRNPACASVQYQWHMKCHCSCGDRTCGCLQVLWKVISSDVGILTSLCILEVRIPNNQSLGLKTVLTVCYSRPKRLYSHDICLQVKTVWNVSRRETLRYSRLLACVIIGSLFTNSLGGRAVPLFTLPGQSVGEQSEGGKLVVQIQYVYN